MSGRRRTTPRPPCGFNCERERERERKRERKKETNAEGELIEETWVHVDSLILNSASSWTEIRVPLRSGPGGFTTPDADTRGDEQLDADSLKNWTIFVSVRGAVPETNVTGRFLVDELTASSSSTSTAAVVESVPPFALRIQSIYPNPSSTSSIVRYGIDRPGSVTMDMYDVMGRLVASPLVDSPHRSGQHELRVDVQSLHSGTYFLRLSVDGRPAGRPLSVVR